MNTDDQLRSLWNSIDIPPQTSGEAERRAVTDRVPTLRHNLYRIFMRMVAICCFGIAVMTFHAGHHLPLFCLATAFFVAMGAVQFYLARSVRELDPAQMSVREMLERVYDIERIKSISRLCGIICGVPLIAYMCFTFASVYGNTVLWACGAGAVVGLVIGLLIHHRTSTLLRRMKEELTEK